MTSAQRAVIFDNDGVLVDTHEFHHQAFEAYSKIAGYPYDEAAFAHVFGRTNRGAFEHFFGRELSDAEVARFADEKEVLFRELATGNIEALPGALEIVRALKAAGWKTAIGTSTPAENIDMIVKDLGAEELFDAISKDGDYANSKPAPDCFLKAAELIGVPAAQCIVVEDAIFGIEAAHAAGMKCVAVATSNAKEKLQAAELVVGSLEELTVEVLAGL